MTHRYNDLRFTMEGGDMSICCAIDEISAMSIDNRTLYSPPQPVAASTVNRNSGNRPTTDRAQTMPVQPAFVQPAPATGQRNNLPLDPGSFLDNGSWATPPSPSEEPGQKAAPVVRMSFSDIDHPAQRRGETIPAHSSLLEGQIQNFDRGYVESGTFPVTVNGEGINPGYVCARSSLGLVPPDMLADTSFGVGSIVSSELLDICDDSCDGRGTNGSSDLAKQTSIDSLSSQSKAGDCSDQPIGRSHGLGTIKKQPMTAGSEHRGQQPANPLVQVATAQAVLGLGCVGGSPGTVDERDPEESMHEVQFEAAELADLDDDFGDFGELQYDEAYLSGSEQVPLEQFNGKDLVEASFCNQPSEGDEQDWYQYFQCLPPLHQDGDGQETGPDDMAGREEEQIPHIPNMHQQEDVSDIDTDDELEAVRWAIASSGVHSMEDRHIGVGRNLDSGDTRDRATRAVRQSAEGEVGSSPVPGDGGGGGDGSSAPGSEDERYSSTNALPLAYTRSQERRIQPVGDDTCPLSDMVSSSALGNGLQIDSVYLRPGELPSETFGEGSMAARPSQMGLGEQSSFFLEDVLAQQGPSGKLVSDTSPVYVDEHGEGVTNLAFQTSLANEAAYQQHMFAQVTDNLPMEDPFMAASICIPDDEFIGSGDVLAMLEDAEKVFEEENIFIQDDQMDATTGPKPHDESWVFKSSIYMAPSASPFDNYGDAHLRISIGQFMRARSEALGSLGDDPAADRPHFGNDIITPPSNRQPCMLLSSVMGTPELEIGDGNNGGMKLRSEGVGNDETGKAGSNINRDDAPMTLSDIDQAPPQAMPGTDATTPSTMPKTNPPNGALGDSTLGMNEMAPRPSEASQSDASGMFSMSTLANLLASTDSDYDQTELMNKLMALTGTKKSKHSENKPEVAVPPQKPQSKPCVSRLPVRKGSFRLDDPLKQQPKVEVSGKKDSVRRGGRLSQEQENTEPRFESTGGNSRTPQSGPTKPTFNPSQTRTLKSRMPFQELTDTGIRDKPKVPQNHKTESLESPKPCPDGQEAQETALPQTTRQNMSHIKSLPSEDQPITAPGDGAGSADGSDTCGSSDWRAPRLSVGHIINNGTYQGTQVRPSQMSPLGSSPGPDHGTTAAAALEWTANLSLDVSKAEPTTGFTYLEGHSEGVQRSFSPADGRDTENLKTGNVKTGNKSDSQVFKKPLPLSLKKNLKTNGKTSKPGSNQNLHSRLQAVGRHDGWRKKNELYLETDPNKENLLNNGLRKAGIGDKVLGLQNSVTEEPVYKASMEGRAQGRADLVSLNRPTRPAPGLPHSESGRATLQVTEKANVSNNSFASHPSQTPVPTALAIPPEMLFHHTEQPAPYTPRDLFTSLNTHQDLPHHIQGHQLHSLPQMSSHAWQQQADSAQSANRQIPTVALEHRASVTNTAEPDLFTPRQFSNQPYLGGNLMTPSPTTCAALVGEDTLSFNHKTPACQSTPFHQRLPTMDMSDIEGQPSHLYTPGLASTHQSRQFHALLQTDTSMDTKTPNVAADFRRTAPAGVHSVEVPRELSFKEVCCVGISTTTFLPIHNPTNRWLECLQEITQLHINGEYIRADGDIPFMFKSKTIVEPQSSDNLSVVFVPKSAGVYVAQLSVYACPVVQNRRALPLADRVAKTITLQAHAERPDIQMVTECPMSLQFGQLPWGSCKGLSMTLVNKGKSNVPLRLAISANTTSWHCFSFEQFASDDVSIVSHTSRPPMPALGKSILNVALKGSDSTSPTSVAQIKVYCKAPERQWSMVSSNFPPEDIQAVMLVEVDTPSSQYVVGRISMQALAGAAKLQIPRSLEMVQLSSSGDQVSTNITLRNGGNIDLQLSLVAGDYTDNFIVSPPSLTIKPGQGEEVLVTFCPRNSQQSTLQTLLLMFVQPDGPVYELPVRGAVIVHQAVELLCSKHFLSFGGINIGKSVTQKMTLVHKSKGPEKFKLEIRSDYPNDFQIKSGLGPSERLTHVKEIIIQPGEEFPVHVSCSPSSFTQVSNKLLIKQASCSKKFTVPLSGYGGTSQLVLQDAVDPARGASYYRNVGEMRPGQNNIQKITIWNIGTRAAFVKALCLSGRSCSQILDGIAAVQPNEFVIKAEASQTVVLVLTPSIKEATLCAEKQCVVAVVKFYYGDEVSRRAFRRCVKGNAASDASVKKCFPRNHPLTNVNFDVSFRGENALEDGVDQFVGGPNDIQVFYKTISNIILSLVGDPPKPDTGCASMPENVTYQQQLQIGGAIGAASPSESLEIKLQNVYTDMAVSRDNERPYIASIPNGTKSEYRHESPSRNSMRNPVNILSEYSSPPIHDIPTSTNIEQNTNIPTGTLEIRPSQVILEIAKDGKMPGAGQIEVLNYNNAEISFDVSWPAHRINVDPDGGTIKPMGVCTMMVSPSDQLFKKGTPLPWSGNFTISSPNENKVVPVLIRKTVDEVLPAPPSNQQKVTQPSRKNRSFQPTLTQKVLPAKPSKTLPSAPGKGTSRPVQRQKPLPIHGSLMAMSSAGSRAQSSRDGRSRSEPGNLDCSQPARTATGSVLSVLSKSVDFPCSCAVGEFQVETIQVKNSDSIPHVLEIIPPQPPFFIKHNKVNVRGGHFVKLPVQFQPSKPGSYERILVVRPDLGRSLSLPLRGTCTCT